MSFCLSIPSSTLWNIEYNKVKILRTFLIFILSSRMFNTFVAINLLSPVRVIFPILCVNTMGLWREAGPDPQWSADYGGRWGGGQLRALGWPVVTWRARGEHPPLVWGEKRGRREKPKKEDFIDIEMCMCAISCMCSRVNWITFIMRSIAISSSKQMNRLDLW